MWTRLLFVLLLSPAVTSFQANPTCDRFGTSCKDGEGVPYPINEYFKHACIRYHACKRCGKFHNIDDEMCDKYFYSKIRWRCGWWNENCLKRVNQYFGKVMKKRQSFPSYYSTRPMPECREKWVRKCMYCRSETCN